MAALQQRLELLRQHLAVQAHGCAARAPPAARRLGGIQVVVHRTPRHAVAAQLVAGKPLVVADQLRYGIAGGLQRHRAHHGAVPPSPNALVCSGRGSMRY
jgi:hypothetical protein